jgi:hypothetical protein
VANSFGDRKIYVVVTPNPDWAWLDVGAMVAQLVIEATITVLTAGAAAPLEAGAMAASAARLGRLAQGVNSIKRVMALIQEMKAFKLCSSAFDKVFSAYDNYDKVSMTFGAADASAMRMQSTTANKNLKAYLDKNAMVIDPGAFLQVNCINYLEVFNAMNPSYWGSISGCSTVQLMIVDENLEYVSTFNTGADNSWIVNASSIVRSKYGSIWTLDPAAGTQGWTPPPPPEPPLPAAGDCIVSLGTDKMLYARPNVASEWVQVPGSSAGPTMTSISSLPDGTLLGIGTNKYIYVKSKLTSPTWTEVPGSGDLAGVVGLPDGSIAAAGADQNLVLRKTLSSPWEGAANNTERIKAVSARSDGAIVAVGLGGEIMTRNKLTGPWAKIPFSGTVSGIACLPDDSTLGVGNDKSLWRRATLTSDWVHLDNTGTKNLSITYLPALPMLIGVGMNSGLWTRATLTSAWVQVPNSGAVTSITMTSDGNFVASATDGRLMARPALACPYGMVANCQATGVTSVSALPDGGLIAVGKDLRLWRKATVGGDWVAVPGSGDVFSILVLADGSLLGVANYDKSLMTRATVTSPWVMVPNSGPVMSIAVLRDGNIVGVAMDNTLCTWKNSVWTPVPNSGSVTSIFAPK